ncbi:hypothetical protein ACRAWF_27915 [Streptomyces sp. L7]
MTQAVSAVRRPGITGRRLAFDCSLNTFAALVERMQDALARRTHQAPPGSCPPATTGLWLLEAAPICTASVQPLSELLVYGNWSSCS